MAATVYEWQLPKHTCTKYNVWSSDTVYSNFNLGFGVKLYYYYGRTSF